MPIPKRKLSKTRRDQRRSHDFLVAKDASSCSNCGELKSPHHICKKCGFYNGKQYKTGTED